MKKLISKFSSAKNLLLCIIFCIFNISMGICASIFTTVTPNKTTVPKYDKFELTINLSQTFTNNYDPAIIDLYAVFTSPTGVKKTAIGFYYVGYNRSYSIIIGKPFPIEINSLTGDVNWKIRFSPDETGTWYYQIYAKTQSGTSQYPASNPATFVCSTSTNKGFIKKRDKKYLQYSNGEIYIPSGANYPSYLTSNGWYNGPEVYGNYYYDDILNILNSNNMNYLRILADYMYGMSLYGKDNTDKNLYYDNTLNQKDASQLDYLVDAAALKKIAIQICLFDYENLSDDYFVEGLWSGYGCGNIKTNPFSGCRSYEHYNPFNIINNSDPDHKGDLTHPKEFFDLSITNSIRIQKNLIRYFIARWGYATNILAWELFNEAEQWAKYNFNHNYYPDPTSTADATTLSNILQWHKNMKDYIKTIDKDHLVTTSTASYGISIYEELMKYMDFMQAHWYTNIIEYSTIDYQRKFFFEKVNLDYKNYGVPFLIGELGDNDLQIKDNNKYMDPNGFELHNNLWTSLFSGHLGLPSMWYIDYIKEQNLYPQYKTIGTFINRLGNITLEFVPTYDEQNGLRIIYLNGKDKICGWAQDLKFKTINLISNTTDPTQNKYLYYLDLSYKPTPSSITNSITINNTKIGYYTIKWYSTEGDNNLVQTETVYSNGSLIVNMPLSLRRDSRQDDAAFIATYDCATLYWNKFDLNGASGNNVGGDLAITSLKQVFYRTNTNTMNCVYYANSQWNWSSLNNSSESDVAGNIVINSNNQVFYRTTSNSINFLYWNGSSWVKYNLSGVTGYNVAGDLAISNDNKVFFRTSTGGINCIYLNGSTWVKSDLNGVVLSGVAGELALSSDNKVFYKTSTGGINCIYLNGSTWVKSDLNGTALNNVEGNITINSNNQVFYRTLTSKINCVYYSNSKWNWSSLNNVADGIAGGDMVADGTKVLFITTSNSINEIYFSGGIWKLDVLNNATGNDAGGDLTILSSNQVLYRTKGILNRSISSIYAGCSSQLKSATEGEYEDSIVTVSNDNKNNKSFELPLIFPNPSNSELTINNAIGKIQIVSILGVVLYTNENEEKMINIKTDEWPEGIYIISITNQDKNYSQSLIIRH